MPTNGRWDWIWRLKVKSYEKCLISTLRPTSSWLYFVPCSWSCCCCARVGFPTIWGLWSWGAKLTAQRATPDMQHKITPVRIEPCLFALWVTLLAAMRSWKMPLNVCLGDMQRNSRAQTTHNAARTLYIWPYIFRRQHGHTAKCESNRRVSVTRPLCKCHSTVRGTNTQTWWKP
jgi:hypothetical protein